MVGLLRGDNPPQVLTDVQTRIWPVVFRGWKFWPLAHIVTYGVIPPRHRVLWVNMLDLVWSSILASLASGSGPQKEEGAVVAAVVVEREEERLLEQQVLLTGELGGREGVREGGGEQQAGPVPLVETGGGEVMGHQSPPAPPLVVASPLASTKGNRSVGAVGLVAATAAEAVVKEEEGARE